MSQTHSNDGVFKPYVPVKYEATELLRFTSRFPDALICYIRDVGDGPVIHASVLDIAKQEQGFGCFFSVNGFLTTDSRTTDNLKSINAFYVDIDFPKTKIAITPDALADFKRDAMHALTALSMHGMTPTFIVETKNGLHAYWCLRNPIRLDEIVLPGEAAGTRDDARIARLLVAYSEIETAIIERLQGDPAAKDATRVLRIPFTYHLKDPSKPFLCRIKFANDADDEAKGTTAALYTFKEVRDFFLSPNQALGKSYEATLETLPEESNAGLVWKDAGEDPLPSWVFDELNRIYPKIDRPSMKSLLSKTGIPEGERNWSLYIAVSAMRESGKTEQETKEHFDSYNGLSAYEIGAVIKSVYKRAAVHSFGWNHPLIARAMTLAEKSRITSIVKTLAAGYYDEKRAARAKLAKASGVVDDSPDAVIARTIEEEEKRERQQVKLEKSRQKELYLCYERVMAERYPRLRFIEDLGFYEWDEGRGIFIALSDEDVRYHILREMEADGLLEYRTETSVKNKLSCLKSLPEIRVPRSSLDTDAGLIPVIGGVVVAATGELLPPSIDRPYLSSLNVRYSRDEIALAGSRWVKFIHEICEGNASRMRLLQQLAGYCLTKSVQFQKMFILLGSGANGKSTFVDVLHAMLGPENAISLSLKDIQEGFGPSYLFGKRLNVVEEISNNYFESDIIKKIVTGSEIAANRKYRDRLIFKPFAKFVFAVNQLPKINDTTHGLYRRVIVIPFDARFETNTEPDLRDKLMRETDLVFLWALQGLRDLMQQDSFVQADKGAESLIEFQEANSPLVEFILWSGQVEVMDAVEVMRSDAFPWSLDDFFNGYRHYCRESGYSPKSLQSILKELQTLTHPKLYNVKIQTNDRRRSVIGLKKKTGTSNFFK